MHPLLGDISEQALTVDELHKKYTELNKKLQIAYRMGMGDAVQQLQLLLADFQAEIQRRNAKMLEDMDNKSAEFKHIIDIK